MYVVLFYIILQYSFGGILVVKMIWLWSQSIFVIFKVKDNTKLIFSNKIMIWIIVSTSVPCCSVVPLNKISLLVLLGSRGSSGSIVSDYGLDDRTIGRSRFDPRQGHRIFLLAPASRPALGPTQPPIQWVPGVLYPGVKSGRGVMLTTHPHLVPPCASMACSETALLYY
jgi:hypothetical protein